VRLGGVGCEALVALNRWFNGVRRPLGFGYWSLSGYLKDCLKPVVDFVTAFETALAHEAARRALAGVVCGHIHCPALRRIEGTVYANCGDWVENNTAVVEHVDGELGLVFPQTPARAETTMVQGAE
jgi:UDP-2,3-diacylglucosamine pyrophosphatase LpxH